MPKKVVIIDSLMGNDYTVCLANALSKNGADVTLIVPENREFDEKVKFKVKRWLPSKDSNKGKAGKIKAYLNYIIKIFFFCIKEKPDAVHFQFFRFKFDAYIMKILNLIGMNVIYTAHNVLPHEKSRIDEKLFKIVYKSANKIIIHSQYIEDKLLHNYPFTKGKTFVIAHGNFDKYVPYNLIDSKIAREVLNIGLDDDVILFFGFIREYKGLDILLDAFEKLKNEKKIKLLIAGSVFSNDLKEHYKKRIIELEVNSHLITNFDFVPNEKVQIYFQAADIVVLPYIKIDHSGIIHLAYSFSKPVIATKVGDFSEVIENEQSGLLVEKNNPEQLAKTILCSFKDKNKLKEMGVYAKKLNDTKYSWDEIAKKTIEIY